MNIYIDDHHLAIVTKIITQYDYSFFVCVSRVGGNQKNSHILILFHFEDIPYNTILKLEKEFEKSDLPFKIDLVDFYKCDPDFRIIILKSYLCLQASSKLRMVEENHLAHFVFLPNVFGFNVQEIDGSIFINCALQSSMFNIVYGKQNKEIKISDSINKAKQIFSGRPFAWWIPQSHHQEELTQALLDNGFSIESYEHAMICDLSFFLSPKQTTGLQIRHVTDFALLEDFVRVLKPYDAYIDEFYNKADLDSLLSNEMLFVGYMNNKPVTIGILFLNGESAGIFSLITDSENRGRGYGTDMMCFLMKIAKEKDCKFVTLSASSDSGYRIYENLGFRAIGSFECFEYNN